MAINASEAMPGRYYRPTVCQFAGIYYVRPKPSRRNSPRAFVDRMVAKRDPLGGYWFQILKAHPGAVLMREHHRGLSTTTGERWEITRTVLLVPTLRLREVKTRPGYTGRK